METENELNKKIMLITVLIQEKFPELLNFLNEMPITIPNKGTPKINRKTLEDYYNSLNNLIKTYSNKNLV